MTEAKDIENIRHIFADRQVGPNSKYSYYSVLVPLIETKMGLQVLFEVRSSQLTRQPGEICFPGGRIEVGETPKQCAIRETMEELNVDNESIQILSELDYTRNYAGFTIYGFLGLLSKEGYEKAKTGYSKDEVKEIFTVPLDFFLQNQPYCHEFELVPEIKEDFPLEKFGLDHSYVWRRSAHEAMVYSFENRAIWGITAKIMKNVADILAGKI